jgi:hypothetical protein
MKHLNEELLISHFYGDDEEHGANEQHLGTCAACSSEYARLRSTLALISADPVPERSSDYVAEVWSRIAPGLVRETTHAEPGFWARLVNPPRWAWAGLAALLVVGAFLAGTRVPRDKTEPPIIADKAEQPAEKIRERVLLVALGDHLDRSQMLLVELANAEPGAPLDISREQQSAENLVDDNRLYRQAAQQVGDRGVSQVLEELERVLVEIANSPSEMTQHDLESLQKRIQGQGLIFKVRVIGSQARRPKAAAASVPEGVKL